MNIIKAVNSELCEEMQYVVHESGLKGYVFPKKGFNKYYAIYGTEYGSLNNTFTVPGEKEMITVPDGIAHYLEHKLFEEEDGSNAFDRFADTGASSNAFTSFDMTAYLFACTDKFYENLEILLDFVNKPYFTDENVAKEQGIIGQEIKMYDDEPEWRVFFNTLRAMFHENPVKIDIAGTVESISHITPEILYKCYNTFYNPSNMVLVMVGDIDINEALKYVDKYVSAEGSLGEIKRYTPNEPNSRVREYIEESLTVSQPIFRIGFKDNQPNMSGDELLKKEIATELILEALFGKSSDLYLELYESGLINGTFGTEADIQKQYGFTLLGGESPNPKKVYEIIKDKINYYIENGIPESSFERAKKVLVSQDIKLFNNLEAMGNAFIRSIINGQSPLEYREVVKAVAYSDVMNRLKTHFDTSNCVLSVVKSPNTEI